MRKRSCTVQNVILVFKVCAALVILLNVLSTTSLLHRKSFGFKIEKRFCMRVLVVFDLSKGCKLILKNVNIKSIFDTSGKSKAIVDFDPISKK